MIVRETKGEAGVDNLSNNLKVSERLAIGFLRPGDQPGEGGLAKVVAWWLTRRYFWGGSYPWQPGDDPSVGPGGGLRGWPSGSQGVKLG